MTDLRSAVELAGEVRLVPGYLASAVGEALASGEQTADLAGVAEVLCLELDVLQALLCIVEARPEQEVDEVVDLARAVRAETPEMDSAGLMSATTDFWNTVERRLVNRGVQVIGSQLAHTVQSQGTVATPGEVFPSGIGHYQDPVEINRGGMGAILLATDPNARRQVAIKVMHQQKGTQPERMQAFLDEAQLNAQLEHPNIVPVHEVGLTPEGRLYFAMKLVRGESLAERLRRKAKQPLAATLRQFLKICEGVGFAHARGVVHRDLKPANIMIGEFGEVLVMDWGLACTLERCVEFGGRVLGTPGFMPPEQARGEAVDQRADIYGLGAILYALLCGRYPFIGDSPMQVLKMTIDGQLVPPSERAPVPRELEAVVLRAMAHDRADRYASAGEMAADIEAFLEGRTLVAADYSPLQRVAKWVGRHRALVAGLAAVMLVAMAVALIERTRQARARQQAAIGELSRARTLLLEAGEADPLDARLEAVAAVDRALQTLPADADALALRREAGEALGRFALTRGDYTLARHAFGALAAHGAAADRVAELQAVVDEAQHAELRRRLQRVEWMLAQLALPLDHREAAAAFDDFVIEASGYKDEPVIARLIAALAGAEAPWSDPLRDVATFACRALGRSEDPRAVEALAAFVERVEDRELIAEAGLALCLTRDERARPALLALRARLGKLSRVWLRIARRFALIPDASEQPLRTAREFLERGLLAKQTGDLATARRCYQRAIALDPELGSAHHNLALMEADAGRHVAAVRGFGAALGCPQDARARAVTHAMRAASTIQLRRYEESVRDCDRAIELAPTLAEAWWVRSMARYKLGKLTEATADVDRAISIDGEDARFHASRSHFLIKQHKPKPALASARRAVALDPHSWRGQDALGVSLRISGQPEEALAALTEAIRLAGRSHSDPYFHRAVLHTLRGSRRAAIADYTSALALYPDHQISRQNRAWMYTLEGQFEPALKDMERALERWKDNPVNWNLRGNIHYRRKAYDEALSDYRRAIQLQPAFPAPHYSIGHILQLRGKHSEAVPMLRRFLELAPRTPERKQIEAYLRKHGGG